MITKSYYSIFFAAHFFCAHIFLLGMDNPKNTVPQAVALFNTTFAAIGTNKNCLLIKNPTESRPKQSIEILYDHPVSNLIPDKKNQRLGIIFKDFFLVYDITTKKKVWSQTAYSKNCSAAFSPFDNTIFFCDNRQLTSNNEISMELPCSGSISNFGIECHPKRKSLLHQGSNQTLIEHSFQSKTNRLYSPQITNNGNILRAFYSPEGNYIALLTDQYKIFIYDSENNSTTPVRKIDNTLYDKCRNPIFIPHSDIIAFSLDNSITIHFWDFKKKENLSTITDNHDFSVKNDNPLIKNLDFSDDGTYILSLVPRGGSTEPTNSTVINSIINRKLFSHYCLLNAHCFNIQEPLPLDIIRLLIQQLRVLYKL